MVTAKHLYLLRVRSVENYLAGDSSGFPLPPAPPSPPAPAVPQTRNPLIDAPGQVLEDAPGADRRRARCRPDLAGHPRHFLALHEEVSGKPRRQGGDPQLRRSSNRSSPASPGEHAWGGKSHRRLRHTHPIPPGKFGEESWRSVRSAISPASGLRCSADASSDSSPQVSKLLAQKSSSFEHSNIYRVSVAAAPLASWVKANIK